jgi:hypothetical protein
MPATQTVTVTTSWTLVSTGAKAVMMTWLAPSPCFFALTITADAPTMDVGHIVRSGENLPLVLEAGERLWARSQIESGSMIVTEGTP